ncbi:MAG: tripartite tricarboxylate transporter substrate binding protein, partial [Comamonadaceae bacterium]
MSSPCRLGARTAIPCCATRTWFGSATSPCCAPSTCCAPRRTNCLRPAPTTGAGPNVPRMETLVTNTPHWTRKTVVRALFAATGALALGAAQAQDYPSRTIRIVTPYDPGSVVDSTTRIVADELGKKLGQTVVVENKSGGFGMVAMNTLLAAPADGYTLLTDTPASAINPTLNKARYNPKTDIAAIAQFMKLPFAIATSPTLKARTAAELVALAKKEPGSINVAVAGTSTGLVGQLFALQTGTKFLDVPYKGAGAATLAVLKNEAQVIFLDSANLAPYIKEGKLTGL